MAPADFDCFDSAAQESSDFTIRTSAKHRVLDGLPRKILAPQSGDAESLTTCANGSDRAIELRRKSLVGHFAKHPILDCAVSALIDRVRLENAFGLPADFHRQGAPA